jgi:two-component system nitrogen regulation sensor histidine kinase NtrY
LAFLKKLKRLYKGRKKVRFFGHSKRAVWLNRFVLLLLLAAVISGFSTYAALNEIAPFTNDPSTVIWLLNLDLVLLLLLVTIIARRSINLWSGQRAQVAGSRLHVRLVFIFSLLAGIPAIMMAIFATLFLHFGAQSWFGDRVRTAVSESQAVAQAYLEEHQQVIRADIFAMAADLNREADMLIKNPVMFKKAMETQSYLRNFSEAAVFDNKNNILASTGLEPSTLLLQMPFDNKDAKGNNGLVIMTDTSDDSVRALIKLESFERAYLYVSRLVDPVVLARVSGTREAAEDYAKLESHLSELQVTITMIFVVVALLLMFAAIGFGILFARQLARPLGELITAADRVRAGDFTARVPHFSRKDEFDQLGRTFNRMTSQLQEQRDELIAANRQLDRRRQFTETVLAGVSSGIVGIDEKSCVTLANSSAADLLNEKADALIGKGIGEIMPELPELLKIAHEKPDKITQSEIPFIAEGQSKRIFLVRIAIEMIGDDGKGAVLTFDDITELQAAQRKAAWADVARRIAHEIKNPLTPIQLSAERLKRKYLKQITDNPEVFSQCTDTIIHHVGDIGRMVNEFSNFARMPEPVMKQEDLNAHIRDMMTFQQQAHPEIKFNLFGIGSQEPPLVTAFDGQQIRQAVTNIIQNAIDSIHTRMEDENGDDKYKGQINIMLSDHPETSEILISVSDNGQGFPDHEDTGDLTEPYVTQKEKGTGLGLAIVKKIMEDHRGRIILGRQDWIDKITPWGQNEGATVTLILSADKLDNEEKERLAS